MKGFLRLTLVADSTVSKEKRQALIMISMMLLYWNIVISPVVAAMEISSVLRQKGREAKIDVLEIKTLTLKLDLVNPKDIERESSPALLHRVALAMTSVFDFEFPPRLVSVFYATFHETRGPEVLHEVPDGAIIPSEGTDTLFDFDAVSEYIIPKTALCGRLVTISAGRYKIMGFPVAITDHDKYQRNTFMFNLCCVFDRDADIACYEPIVRKLGRILRSLEEESSFLSQPPQIGAMYRVIEQLLEDLNSYCECQIPIDPANMINLKLFPVYPNPSSVSGHQVPISTVELSQVMDVNWDLTMQKVSPLIDGINNVKRIAELADVNYSLTRKCMEHLLYYGCIIMIDIFQFSNIYSVKPDIDRLVQDTDLQKECIWFVSKSVDKPSISFPRLFALYCNLKHGLNLRDWIEENAVEALNIDVRRFISFGVIKGFLHRVHRYPILVDPTRSRLPPSIKRHLDGRHSFDELCVDFSVSYRELDRVLSVDNCSTSIFR